MAKTPSVMIPLGTTAPDFSLLEPLSGQTRGLQDLKSPQGTAIFFICNHCPFVKHIAATIAQVAKAYQEKGIAFIAINSNDVANYPEDSPEKMVEAVREYDYTFPYLFDADQSVARAYDAACTPDLFLFDGNLSLVYRGQFDDARPGDGREVTGADLTAAMDALLSGQPIAERQKPSIGCNIKWID